jgi:hypothetical protein
MSFIMVTLITLLILYTEKKKITICVKLLFLSRLMLNDVFFSSYDYIIYIYKLIFLFLGKKEKHQL